jgi:hypothetical protein
MDESTSTVSPVFGEPFIAITDPEKIHGWCLSIDLSLPGFIMISDIFCFTNYSGEL